MNKETEEVYEFMFKDKIAKASPVTTEYIAELNDNKSSLGNPLEEGQQVLIFMEQEDVSSENESPGTNLKMHMRYFMYPKELELLAQRYSYLWTVQDMPVMKKRERGG